MKVHALFLFILIGSSTGLDLSGIGNWFQNAADSIGQAADNAGNNIGGWFKNTSENFAHTVVNAVNNTGNAFHNFGQTISNKTQELKNTIANKTSELKNAISHLANNLGQDIDDTFGSNDTSKIMSQVEGYFKNNSIDLNQMDLNESIPLIAHHGHNLTSDLLDYIRNETERSGNGSEASLASIIGNWWKNVSFDLEQTVHLLEKNTRNSSEGYENSTRPINGTWWRIGTIDRNVTNLNGSRNNSEGFNHPHSIHLPFFNASLLKNDFKHFINRHNKSENSNSSLNETKIAENPLGSNPDVHQIQIHPPIAISPPISRPNIPSLNQNSQNNNPLASDEILQHFQNISAIEEAHNGSQNLSTQLGEVAKNVGSSLGHIFSGLTHDIIDSVRNDSKESQESDEFNKSFESDHRHNDRSSDPEADRTVDDLFSHEMTSQFDPWSYLRYGVISNNEHAKDDNIDPDSLIKLIYKLNQLYG